jgi:ribonuclease HII
MCAAGKRLVGIDEAGYGPNLGPLVVVAISLDVPDDTSSGELWDRLDSVVRQCTDGQTSRGKDRSLANERLIIDDSKKVYSAGDGLDGLERAALAWIGPDRQLPRTLRELWAIHCLTPARDIDESPWHAQRDLRLPHCVPLGLIDESRRALAAGLTNAGFAQPDIACQIIMPRRFNELATRADSKSTALFQVNAELLRHIWVNSEAACIDATLDKHGGRNFYGDMLQQHFCESIVLAGREGAATSQYSFSVGGRTLKATFTPKADAQHMLVAWASIVAKYIRELCMKAFNDFWSERVPGLRPTAGYPVDARRFWNDIRPSVDELGIDRATLWRTR